MQLFRPRLASNNVDTQSISVTNTSAPTQLTGKGGGLLLQNVGTGTCFVSFGNKNCAATTTAIAIPAGTEKIIRKPECGEYIAAISGTSTTLLVTSGDVA
jgi:hypothetical protein